MSQKPVKVALLVLVVFLCCGGPLLAGVAEDKPDAGSNVAFYGTAVGAGLGAGITIIGAGLGFGRIGAAALESMARQPETAGQVQTGMLIIAALLEGATFFSLIVCILLVVL
jgi:F-type H+-transporting ATPase subunit c